MGGIRIRARVTMLPGDSGGRTVAARSGYRPNHYFGDADGREMDLGQVSFTGPQALYAGETIECEISFISRPGLKDILVPGREWRIQEGLRVVGVGTVLEVLELSD